MRNTACPATNTALTVSSLAVHHPRHSAELLGRLLGVAVQQVVKVRWIDNHQVGAVAHSQMPGVDLIPVGQLAGEPVHRLLDGHERRTSLLGVVDVAQQPQAQSPAQPPSRHRLGPLPVALETQRCRHGAVAIAIVAILVSWPRTLASRARAV